MADLEFTPLPRLSEEASVLITNTEEAFNELAAKHLLGTTLVAVDGEAVDITPEILGDSKYVYMKFGIGVDIITVARSLFDNGTTKTFTVTRERTTSNVGYQRASVGINAQGVDVRYNPDQNREDYRETTYFPLETGGWLYNQRPPQEALDLLGMISNLPLGHILRSAGVKLSGRGNNFARYQDSNAI